MTLVMDKSRRVLTAIRAIIISICALAVPLCYCYQIEVDTALKPLQYNANAAPLPWVLSVPRQEAVFNFHISGSPAPDGYRWSVARGGAEGDAPPADSVIIDGAGTASTAIGRVYAPHEFQVKCTLTVGGNVIPLTRVVAAFGGPLNFAFKKSYYHPVQGSLVEIPSPESYLWNSNGAYKPGMPHYCQFFGHDPGNPYEAMEQEPSWHHVAPYDQPGTCSYDWSVPEFLTNVWTGGQSAVWLKANDKGEAADVLLTIACDWTPPDFGPVIHDEVDDNTGDDPLLSRRITARTPSEQSGGAVTRKTSTLGIHTGGLPGCYCAKQHDVLLVKDQSGSTGMPGVVVNERFPGRAGATWPPGLQTNHDEEGWITLFAPSNGAAVPFTLRCPTWPDDGGTLSHKVEEGVFGGTYSNYDNVCYVWISGDTTPTYTAEQHFVGGSWSIDLSGTGVLIDKWQMSFTHAAIGDRGSVTHSALP